VASGAGTSKAAAGIVLSDRAAAGEYEDRSGPVLRRFLEAWGFAVREIAVVPDEPEPLIELLDRWRVEGLPLVLTAGGTGLGPRDRTPDVLREWADYEVPGIGEWMRAESAKHVVAGWLSRGGAFVRAPTMVVALPGSPRALEEILPGLEPILRHALEMMEGQGHG
jgi:molybdenum cofactor synthesis domain-containing protein